jgi:ketosteroid isomerase-like protein
VDKAFVETARVAGRFVDAYTDRDIDAMLAVMSDDVVSYPLPLFGFGPYRGHAGVREWWAAMEGAGAQYEVAVRQVRQLGPELVAVFGGLHSSTTGKVLGPWACLVRVRNALITETHFYLSDEDTLHELGLLAQDARDSSEALCRQAAQAQRHSVALVDDAERLAERLAARGSDSPVRQRSDTASTQPSGGRPSSGISPSGTRQRDT